MIRRLFALAMLALGLVVSACGASTNGQPSPNTVAGRRAAILAATADAEQSPPSAPSVATTAPITSDVANDTAPPVLEATTALVDVPAATPGPAPLPGAGDRAFYSWFDEVAPFVVMCLLQMIFMAIGMAPNGDTRRACLVMAIGATAVAAMALALFSGAGAIPVALAIVVAVFGALAGAFTLGRLGHGDERRPAYDLATGIQERNNAE